MEELRYPVGRFVAPDPITAAHRQEWLDVLAAAPANLQRAVAGLSDAQLDTPYREGGWTVRQVVHHLADTHLNCYVRFKLALTENEPTIKLYDENRWSELLDARTAPVSASLGLFESLHYRWVLLLRSLSDADWQKAVRHPERGLIPLERLLGTYAWHARHHTAHISQLRQVKGW